MPTYAYRCTECSNAFDIYQSFSDDALSVCPECGGRLRKVFGSIGVTFSGSGFYRTDSRAESAGGSVGSGGSEDSGSSGSDSGSGSAGKSSDSATSSSGSSGSSSSSGSPSTPSGSSGSSSSSSQGSAA